MQLRCTALKKLSEKIKDPQEKLGRFRLSFFPSCSTFRPNRGLHKVKQTLEMPIEITKMCSAHSEDNKIPPNIICHPNTNYARDLQAQGAHALQFFVFLFRSKTA